MKYSIEELNNLTTGEMQSLIEKDAAADGEILFMLENELKDIIRHNVFGGSETFDDMDEETTPERNIRLLIESLDFMGLLGAINALSDAGDKE